MQSVEKLFLSIVLAAIAAFPAQSPAFSSAGTPEASKLAEQARAALGKKLFFDARLSVDGKISCSSCHQPAHAFSDGRSVSVGVGNQTGTRNTPSLSTLFEGEPLFWDGRRDRLPVAVLDPITNSVEMAQPDLAALTHSLSQHPEYVKDFGQLFPGSREITAEHVGEALADFIRTLPRRSSAYDRYAAGEKGALTADAVQGLRLFEGKAGCSGCHQTADARFTDSRYHHSGVGLGDVESRLGPLTTEAVQRNLQGHSLGNEVAHRPEMSALGRFMVSHQSTDVGAFRTPSLRNVAVTAPYMHDGSVKTLAEAIDLEIYYRGLSTGQPVSIATQERQYLLAFLESLTEPTR